MPTSKKRKGHNKRVRSRFLRKKNEERLKAKKEIEERREAFKAFDDAYQKKIAEAGGEENLKKMVTEHTKTNINEEE